MAEKERMGIREGAKEALGMMWNNIKKAPGDIGATLKHKYLQGAQELASALYAGSGFVQYGDQAPFNAPQSPEGQQPQATVHGEARSMEQQINQAMQAQEANLGQLSPQATPSIREQMRSQLQKAPEPSKGKEMEP